MRTEDEGIANNKNKRVSHDENERCKFAKPTPQTEIQRQTQNSKQILCKEILCNPNAKGISNSKLLLR